jgi:hypothetical protein
MRVAFAQAAAAFFLARVWSGSPATQGQATRTLRRASCHQQAWCPAKSRHRTSASATKGNRVENTLGFLLYSKVPAGSQLSFF